jgi:hypothetical protein
MLLQEAISIAWDRLKIIISIVSDRQARAVATLFYFTILVPFGLVSRFLTDPLQQKTKSDHWLERPPVPTELESAKRQG